MARSGKSATNAGPIAHATQERLDGLRLLRTSRQAKVGKTAPKRAISIAPAHRGLILRVHPRTWSPRGMLLHPLARVTLRSRSAP